MQPFHPVLIPVARRELPQIWAFGESRHGSGGCTWRVRGGRACGRKVGEEPALLVGGQFGDAFGLTAQFRPADVLAYPGGAFEDVGPPNRTFRPGRAGRAARLTRIVFRGERPLGAVNACRSGGAETLWRQARLGGGRDRRRGRRNGRPPGRRGRRLGQPGRGHLDSGRHGRRRRVDGRGRRRRQWRGCRRAGRGSAAVCGGTGGAGALPPEPGARNVQPSTAMPAAAATVAGTAMRSTGVRSPARRLAAPGGGTGGCGGRRVAAVMCAARCSRCRRTRFSSTLSSDSGVIVLAPASGAAP